MEPLDRGSWYYFNKRTKQCRGFHYTGCGKSGNNFLTKEECHEKCEKRYPRSVALPQPAALPRSKKKKPFMRLSAGYSGTKPVEKTAMLRHVVLDGVNRTYYKSDAVWIDYAFCVGYRYNVSGKDTVLNVHFCSDNTNSECISQASFLWFTGQLMARNSVMCSVLFSAGLTCTPGILPLRSKIPSAQRTPRHIIYSEITRLSPPFYYLSLIIAMTSANVHRTTDGEEFCNVQRPFLRGTNLYTWYFTTEIKDSFSSKNSTSHHLQRNHETIAAILLLKPNHCHDIC
ncbi:unnamed protein product [Strongylus vulgaris]|uniref:BPTI/Kunitz inhibitor domain-containing protein n=1 Tax=Strongylus vulgaris TaxID=40348 RepID=A0A3P7J7N9_STRVU|nr:unnamed protein product [Strongylus vulgaris]